MPRVWDLAQDWIQDLRALGTMRHGRDSAIGLAGPSAAPISCRSKWRPQSERENRRRSQHSRAPAATISPFCLRGNRDQKSSLQNVNGQHAFQFAKSRVSRHLDATTREWSGRVDRSGSQTKTGLLRIDRPSLHVLAAKAGKIPTGLYISNVLYTLE